MAQDFERVLKKDLPTALNTSTVFASTTDDTLIGIRIANTHASASVNVSAVITNTSVDYYLVKDAPIPVGGSLDLIDGGAKIIMQNGDTLDIICDTASSADAIVSYIDTISS